MDIFLLLLQLQVLPELGVVGHAEAQVPFLEAVLDLLQGLLTEVPRLGDIVLGLARQVADSYNFV